MKTIHILGLLIVLIIIASQPLLTSLFIQNPDVINFISILAYLLIAYPVFLAYKQIIKKLKSRIDQVSLNNIKLRSEVDRLYELTKDDFIYYKHNVNEPFSKISNSVNDILQILPEDFKKHYKMYKAEPLFSDVFERVKKYEQQGIRVPQYEVELKSKKGIPVKFEVLETPVFNDNKELISVWGTLHHIHSQNMDLNLSDCSDNDKFKLLYDNINDGVLLIKGDRFIDCNTKALKIFNSSLDQIIMYSPFSNKYSPVTQPSGKNSKEDALKRMNLAYEGKLQKFEWVHLKQSGEPFNAEVKLVRHEYANEVYLLAIVKDVTLKYTLNNHIHEKVQMIKLLFTHSPIAMVEFNLEYEVRSFNNAFLELFTLKKEIVNKELKQILKSDSLDELYEVFKGEKEKSKKIQFQKSDLGETFEANVKFIPINENKIRKGGMLLIEEINELKKLKNHLNIQQNNFEEIIEKSKDVLYKYDIKNKKYIYVSKSVEKIFEYTSEEFKAMSDVELKSMLHPKELNRANLIIAKFFDEKETPKKQQLEYRIINKLGVVKWIRDSYTIVMDENNEPAAILGIIGDLTKRKLDEERIRQKEGLLEVVTENIDQGMAVIIENKIELINSKLIDITGYSEEELNQAECLFVFAQEDIKEKSKNEYIKIISGASKEKNLSYWLKTKSGENIFIENEYYLDPKNPQNRYVLTKDITHKKLNEYKKNPSKELKKELETYLKEF